MWPKYQAVQENYSPDPPSPIKSPRPDSRNANKIVETQQPQMHDIRHQQSEKRKPVPHPYHYNISNLPYQTSTPVRAGMKNSHIIFEQTRPSAQNSREESPINSSRVKHTKIEIIAQPSFELNESRHSNSRLNRNDSMELDYIKLLRSKEETIKQYKEIIEFIKNNHSQVEEKDQIIKQLRAKNYELSGRLKVLQNENQHLLNAIDTEGKKGNQSKRLSEDRSLKELKDSLRIAKLQLSDTSAQYQRKFYEQKQQINRLKEENMFLSDELKFKESKTIRENIDNEKDSLSKLKHHYNSNIQQIRDNIKGSIGALQTTYRINIDKLNQKIDVQNARISGLEKRLTELNRNQSRMINQEEFEHLKKNYQQMQKTLMQKNEELIIQVGQHRKNNDKLIEEVIKANQTLEDLNKQSQRLKNQQNGDPILLNAELSAILQQKNQLLKKLNSTEVDNMALRSQYDQLNLRKGKQIEELQKKIEMILGESDSHSKKQRLHFDRELSRIRKEAENKQKELVDYYEIDKNQNEQRFKLTVNNYKQENESLQTAIVYKQQQLHHSQESIRQLSMENAELAHRCKQFTKTTEELARRLQQLDALTEQKRRLAKELAETEIRNNDLTVRFSQQQRENIEIRQNLDKVQKEAIYLHKNLEGQKIELIQFSQQNQTLKRQIHSKDQELKRRDVAIKNLQQQIKVLADRIGGLPLEEDLIALRKMVAQSLVQPQKSLVYQFHRLTLNYQDKIEENLKLMAQLESIKTSLADHQRQKEILHQKNSFLLQTSSIFEKQIKQRRFLYDELLREKNRVQRENLMIRKIKEEHTMIDQSQEAVVSTITSKIDKLLDIERHRQQSSKLIQTWHHSPQRTPN